MAAHAAGWTLDDLMSALARHGSGQATFSETKTMAVLDIPITSSGELRYLAPDFLEMRTLHPKPQTLTLRANQLSIESDGARRQIDLGNYPYVAILIGSIRSTLNGDSQALKRDFRLKFDGDAAKWRLTLTPLDSKMRARVREIRISGRRDQVRRIDVDQADGDSSQMLIRPLPQS
jgi:hypothetical protein